MMRAPRSASFFLSLSIATHSLADDLQPLGDEFNHAGSITQWRDIQQVEHWGTDQLEQWDINTSTLGMMRLTPRTSSWYNQLRGALVFKTVSGNFIATTRLRIRSRHNPANPDEVPNRQFSLAGLFAHVPHAPDFRGAPILNTATDLPAQNGVPIYPYPGSGSSWVPFNENYLFLSYGAANQAGLRTYEVKSTRNSRSLLYYNNLMFNGRIPNTAEYAWVELQLVRVGQRALVLRRHPDGAGGWGRWIVENRYPNSFQTPFPLTGTEVQLGITAYTDWNSIQNSYYQFDDNPGQNSANDQFNRHRQWQAGYRTLRTGTNEHGGAPHTPDLITDVEYFRLERPHPSITEAALDALPTTFVTQQNQSVRLLPVEGIGQFLGDAANTPLGSVILTTPTFTFNEDDGVARITVSRSGPSLDRPLSLDYALLQGTASPGVDYTEVHGTLFWAPNDPSTKTFDIPLHAADLVAEGDESFQVSLGNLNGPATFEASAPTLLATVILKDSPYDAWRSAHFGSTANNPEAAPAADTDADGIATLLEFAYGTHPLQPNLSPLRASFTNDRFTLSFPLNPLAKTVVFQVEAAEHLAGPWEIIASRAPGGEWSTRPGISADETAGSVNVHDTTALPARFARLRVSIEQPQP